jgi:hypothetical protein
MDYYLFAIIVTIACFLSAMMLVVRRRSLWLVAGAPILVALAAFVLMKVTGWVDNPTSGVNSISDVNDLTGAPKTEYIVMFILGILTQIALGTLLQKYKGLSILETIGFNMVVSAIVASLVLGASI